MTDTPKEFQDEIRELETTKDRSVEPEQLAVIQQVVVTLSHGIKKGLKQQLSQSGKYHHLLLTQSSKHTTSCPTLWQELKQGIREFLKEFC